MAKVLLLGGTGAIGVYLRSELVALGHEVIVTSRAERSPEEGVRFIVGNGKDIAFIRDLLERERPQVIVDFMIYSTDEFSARCDLLLSSVRQYIFLSSYRVFNEQVPLTENSPRLLDTLDDTSYLKTDEYGLCKARCENVLRKSGWANWTIVRPSITYSKERFQFGCLEAKVICYRAFRGLPVVIPSEMLVKRTTMSWGGDIAKMISRLVLNKRAYGEDFNAGTSESHTWAEISAMYNEILGLEVKEVPMVDYMTICSEYQVRYDRLFNRHLDNTKILEATGLRQTDLMTLKEGLSHEILSNKTRLLNIKPDIVQNARIDRMCNRVVIPRGSISEKFRYLSCRFVAVGVCFRIVGLVRCLCK